MNRYSIADGFEALPHFSRRWLVFMALILSLVFVSQAQAQHTAPSLCDDGSSGRLYSECCDCNLAHEVRECPEGYKYGSCTHENIAACSNLCAEPSQTPPCGSSIACEASCCDGIEHGYGETLYSRCTSLPNCSRDPNCTNLVWQSDVCRGTIAQGEYCRVCSGNTPAERINKQLNGQDCNAPCGDIPSMIGVYTPAQIETITNHCYVAKVNGWADRGNYENSACLKVQRDAGHWRDTIWDYLCHHFEEGGHPWPECVPPTTITPSPSTSPSPSPTPSPSTSPSPSPTDIPLSGRIYCQDPDSSADPYPINGATLNASYISDDEPVHSGGQSNSNGLFSIVLYSPDDMPFELKLLSLPANGTLSNGQPYSEMVGPTGSTIGGCNFGQIDSLPSYTCDMDPYNNLVFKYTNCEPETEVLYPQCQEIQVRSVADQSIAPIDPDNLGAYVNQSVQFVCLSSYPELVSRYEFRVIQRPINDDLTPIIIPLGIYDPTRPDTMNISQAYTVLRGQYAVQCRICTQEEGSDSNEVCQPWDWDGSEIPWPPITVPSVTPEPTADPSISPIKCSPEDCGKPDFMCVDTHRLQCLADPTGKCSWQCVPVNSTKTAN